MVILPMNILVTPAGSFLTLGIILAIVNKIRGGKKDESN
jgi:Na+-translocating ferredoxin:NAD+ oxidoreductase RnfE subunit